MEVQGEYVTQSMIDSEIAYTSLTITYDSIPGENLYYMKKNVMTSCLQDGESATVGVASEVIITSSRMSLSMGTCAINVSRYRCVEENLKVDQQMALLIK